jgi:TolA-binding protein
LALFLDGRLLLAEARPDEAVARFQTLVDQPRGQSPRVHHLAAVGLAEALKARGSSDDAAAFLLGFIQKNPDSTQIAALFGALAGLLPETPTPNDPILERVAQWITPPEIPATGPVASLDTDAAGAWPADSPRSSNPGILAHSLFLRATGLLRTGAAATTAEARSLLTRLRLEFPTHSLASRTLLVLADEAMKNGATDLAFSLLDSLRENSPDSPLKGKAAFIEARAAYDRGDQTRAAALFEEAANHLGDRAARSARFNAAVIRLASNPGSITIQQTDPGRNPALAADLELEQALSQPDAQKRRAAIEEFLTREPGHPRAPEARLAAAEAALAGASPDLSFARAQLDTIAAEPDRANIPPPARLAMAHLRIEDLSGNPPAAIAAAREILEKFPADPAAPEAMLVLGRNLFETRSYNDARLVLEKLAATDTDPGRAQAAWLLAARSAALVATSQSQMEALVLFDKAIDAKGPVSPLARLEKARLLIDMNRIPEAAAFLRKWFGSLTEKDPLHLPAGILLGEALYAGSGSDSKPLEEALAVYDKLLVHAREQPAVFNRIQYLRGRTLEQIPDPTDPSGKRERQAFIAYYSVLETEGTPAEWHYFELCGFRALALLEKAGRWPAAVACAKKIASFKGPRAEEAATRASQLQLKHMIWED